MVAGAMVLILGVAGLAIDLASLYVARSEAQRAADAAALAGAEMFVTSGYTSGAISQAAVQALASKQAIDVGNQNRVGGQSPALVAADVSFDWSNSTNPLITVSVQRSVAHGNPLPTFFVKIFGITTASVAASATAEAFNPSGLPFFTKCMKPWVLPNCDPGSQSNPDPNCGGYGMFIDPNTGTVPSPGLAAPNGLSGGVIGRTLTLQQGDPTKPTGPNLYYPADPSAINQGLIECPACGDPSFNYQNNLKCCNLNQWNCGNQNLPPYLPGAAISLYPPGTTPGQVTADAIACLIHKPGQDTLNFNPSSTSPFTVTGGSSNPNPALRNQVFASPPSSSIVNVPLAAPTVYCPGGSCPNTVNLVGFMQIFINDIQSNGTVNATVLSVSKCPSGPPPGPGLAQGFTTIPVRLVQPRP